MNAKVPADLSPNEEAALAGTPHVRDMLIKLDKLPEFRGEIHQVNLSMSGWQFQARLDLEKQLAANPGLADRIVAIAKDHLDSQNQIGLAMLNHPSQLNAVVTRIEAGQSATAPAATVAASAPQQPKGDPADLVKIQQGLKDMGLYKGAADGKMNADTQAALQNLIVRAQMSDVYRHEHGNVEGIYGPKTQKAFDQMVSQGQMQPELMNAIRDMNAKAELRKVYTPQNVDGTVAEIRKDPGLTAQIDRIKPAPPTADELTKLQQGLKAAGLIKGDPTGKLDDQTRQAVETLLVRAQMTGVYKATGEHIDGVYGKDTQKALDAMAAKGQISPALAESIRDLDKKGELEEVYSRGNLGATIAAMQKDPAAMRMINEIAPTATQAAPTQGPARVPAAAP